MTSTLQSSQSCLRLDCRTGRRRLPGPLRKHLVHRWTRHWQDPSFNCSWSGVVPSRAPCSLHDRSCACTRSFGQQTRPVVERVDQALGQVRSADHRRHLLHPSHWEETDVLFVLLAERYETRSVVITSNLVFSQWDTIFKDPMTTKAAIDRLVHHSTILELVGESYSQTEAKLKKKGGRKEPGSIGSFSHHKQAPARR